MPRTKTYLALLRGVNVGGRNKLKMADLTALFEASGATNVRTHLQSGNVLFDLDGPRTRLVLATVGSGLLEAHGVEVPIVLRESTALPDILSACPFPTEGVDPTTVHVGFLEARPGNAHLELLRDRESGADEIAVHGAEFYLRTPNGLAGTKFTTSFLDRAFGCVTTVRNWRTAQALADKAKA